MGACGSSLTKEERDELARNKRLEAKARKEQDEENKKLKLLLLGAGESGKSTLFKQMKILFGTDPQHRGFSKAEHEAATKVVYSNILGNMKVLLANCDTHTPAEDQRLASEVLDLEDSTPIDESLGRMLKEIWKDPGVQDTWQHRSNFQVQDALEYFMENMDRIMAPGYVATDQDMLRTRVRTSGIVEAEYNINGVRVAMFDVGGQRNERKKWIHCFDNVTAVIFVAAISEYDQVLYEDKDTNRQDEAIGLFRDMCNSQWFRNKAMILFLNKKDLFRKKLATVPFRVDSGPYPRNTTYNGPVVMPGTASAQDGTPEFEEVVQASTAYLVDLYKAAGRESNPKREIYVKVTCATESDQVKVVMESCKDIILKANLSENGFL